MAIQNFIVRYLGLEVIVDEKKPTKTGKDKNAKVKPEEIDEKLNQVFQGYYAEDKGDMFS